MTGALATARSLHAVSYYTTRIFGYVLVLAWLSRSVHDGRVPLDWAVIGLTALVVTNASEYRSRRKGDA